MGISFKYFCLFSAKKQTQDTVEAQVMFLIYAGVKYIQSLII
jgi:hypothetical protein